MKNAFTLVELLVITAIIVILAAVLFPIFTLNRPSSINDCFINLRQLANGVIEYSEDYDEHVLPFLACKNSTICPGAPSLDVQRLWPDRMAPYVPSTLDPATGAPVYPATGVYRCPDWTQANLLKGADQKDCDGLPPASGLDFAFPIANDSQGRSELYSTYGLSFGMCAPIEEAAKSPYCSSSGGSVAGPSAYGRDGLTVTGAIFAYPGDVLYPQYAHRTGRLMTDVWRPSQTAFLGDGGTWKSASANAIMDVMGCEGRDIHYMNGYGGNFGMMDGHAMFIRGNADAYRMIGPDGLWIEQYFTFYE